MGPRFGFVSVVVCPWQGGMEKMKPPTPKSVKPGLVAEKVGRSVLKGAKWGAKVKVVMLSGIVENHAWFSILSRGFCVSIAN